MLIIASNLQREIAHLIVPLVCGAGFPNQQEFLNRLGYWQVLVNQEQARAILAAFKKGCEVGRHGCEIMAHQNPTLLGGKC
jgi:hypothetical protein